MKRTAWAMLGLSALLTTAEAASFDCGKATSTVEKLICNDNELSGFDEVLSDLYQTALERSTDKKQTTNEQRLWLKNVRNVCQVVECVKDAYKKRIDTIDFGQETFLHFECVPDNSKILIDNNLSIDKLPVSSHSKELSASDRASLRKRGYYSVQRTMDTLTCKLGEEVYSFFITFHQSKARGECAAAEFWSLKGFFPSGDQFFYTLDGDVCFPNQPLLKSIRLESTPRGRSMNVCSSNDFDAPVVCKDISLPLKK